MSYREYKSPRRQEEERKEKRRRKKNNNTTILSDYDKSLVIIVSFLVIIGFLAIFSATAPKCMREGVFLGSFLVKQVIFSLVGVGAGIFFTCFDYKKLEKYNVPYASCLQF